MQVGVLTVLLGDQPLEDAVEYLDEIGVEAVELACGGYVGDDHLPTQDVLDDEDAQSELLAVLDDHGMDLAALATHNNPTRTKPRPTTRSSATLSPWPTSSASTPS